MVLGLMIPAEPGRIGGLDDGEAVGVEPGVGPVVAVQMVEQAEFHPTSPFGGLHQGPMNVILRPLASAPVLLRGKLSGFCQPIP